MIKNVTKRCYVKKLMNNILLRLGLIKKSTVIKLSFFLTGIISTAWFLVRVIPKPSRATYPCMRAAAPMMSGFVIYLLSLAGSLAAFRKTRVLILRSMYVYGFLFALVVFVDNTGGDGRIKSTYAENAIPYSVDNGKLATGPASCAVEADYLINMALLKGHVGQGVTLCAKNWYGVTSTFSKRHRPGTLLQEPGMILSETMLPYRVLGSWNTGTTRKKRNIAGTWVKTKELNL